MKAIDVILQLMAVLPEYTDSFSNKVEISSITSSGLTATAQTNDAHGIADNSVVNIIGALSPISISAIVRNGSKATVQTDSDHDLTEGHQNTVMISGSNEVEFNGEFNIIDVLNRRTFTIEVEDDGPLSATGSPIALNISAYGYNGFKQITVVDPTTFTYQIDKAVPLPAGGSPFAFFGHRITGSVDIERFLSAYTAQNINEYWACVVLGDVAASKDRNVNSDATYTRVSGQALLQDLVQPFSVFIVAPCKTELAARNTRDEMEEVLGMLSKSLIGVKFKTYLAAEKEFMTTFVSHGLHEYNGAYYAHEFAFESVARMTFADSIGEDFNVAFRDIDLTMIFNTGVEEMTANINLDEQPL